ncbi:uncharacterized protein LOC106877823 isoform X2 [Octopus bimaculoides]|uniref:uncharacterized protein LOC106877823 isoform X2 n=1 Tax=Octopus bimaculoides TaxID=37653 RepID=UPI0022E7EB07|nr:uncharacterized protein LOC106877823 isoform X2 [Octopus bimaculoides]
MCLRVISTMKGIAEAQNCDEMQSKHCPMAKLNFTKIMDGKTFCRRYKQFHRCLHHIDYCYRYYDFAYAETCKSNSFPSDTSRPEVRFKTVLFTAIVVMLPMHI